MIEESGVGLMKQILVYGDSVSWGMIPGTRGRFPFDKRWPGHMEVKLRTQGLDVRVIENCLAGRCTVWSDRFRVGRNGAEGLHEAVEMNAPLALVIIALGINDFYNTDTIQTWASAQGIARLIEIVQTAPVEGGRPGPDILVAAPPPIAAESGVYGERFSGAAERSHGLAVAYRAVAEEWNTRSLDLGVVSQPSRIDGVHLDADQHSTVADAMAREVARILEPYEQKRRCIQIADHQLA